VPPDLTVSQLIGGLKPTQFWASLGAIALLISTVFGLGVKVGTFAVATKLFGN